MSDHRRVCIIGAGISGLPCIKACLEEGLTPVCYEMTSDIGGRWNVRQFKNGKSHSTMMSTSISTSSKEMLAYSDFPPPESTFNYMKHPVVLKYLRSYADHFGLLKHVEFDKEVTEVKKSESYKTDGSWDVQLSNGKTEKFDFVLLASGIHKTPRWPENLELKKSKFNGKIIHSQQFDTCGIDWSQRQRILIIGSGNSAIEIAEHLSAVQEKVAISSRKGMWIRQRVGTRGKPGDIELQTRCYNFANDYLPTLVLNQSFRHSRTIDHEVYGLHPGYTPCERNAVTSDAIANHMISGRIQMFDEVKSIGENSITFVDGQKYDKIDVIICATGFETTFEYLQSSLPKRTDGYLDLNMRLFPAKQSHDTLAIVGMIEPNGAISPIAELQSRLAVRVFKGMSSLPKHCPIAITSRPHLEVDSIPYCDKLATLIGCMPPRLSLLTNDQRLLASIIIGANVPYVYRLKGPHAWKKAKQTILETPSRVWHPLNSRQASKSSSSSTRFNYNNLSVFKTITGRLVAIFIAVVLSTAYFAMSPPKTSGDLALLVTSMLVTVYHVIIVLLMHTSSRYNVSGVV